MGSNHAVCPLGEPVRTAACSGEPAAKWLTALVEAPGGITRPDVTPG